MLLPALLRVCCLAVMAPALTKAVRQADGLGLLILPQKKIFITTKTQAVDNSDRLSALVPADARKGDIVSSQRVNGKSWHIPSYYTLKSSEGPRKISPHDPTDVTPVSERNVIKNDKNDWCRLVGVLTPTAENSDSETTMNEDIADTQQRMGLLNANTSLECDFRSKIEFSRCSSPMCVDMSPKEHEGVDDLSVKCPIGSLLSPPGSPKSVSGESTSTVTAHNPSVVTFVELEEAKNIHRKSMLRAKELLSRLRKLQIAQMNRHTVSQLKSLVSHYQKMLSIPCQKSTRHNVTIRRAKDSDLKTEFSHKEDGRNLASTFNNLVRKYESPEISKSSPLPVKSPTTPIDGMHSSDKVHLRIPTDDSKQVKQITGFLSSRVKHLESVVDSDATESSSGGESCDELEGYEDTKLHSIPVHKRAVWMWAFERAPIAKRWTWLQSQVSDLEYRVRQIADLLAQARAAKSTLCFEEAPPREPSNLDTVSLKKTLRSVNGYLDHSSVISNNGYHTAQSVPSSAEALTDDSTSKNNQFVSEDCGTVSRTRPIKPEMFRKRKLLRTTGLHLVSRKAARLSSVRCNCNTRGDVLPCILCSGRYNNTQSVDPCVMPLLERVALLQPTFHPLLSFEKDVALSLYFESHLKNSETYYSVPKQISQEIRKPNLGLSSRSLGNSMRNHSRKLTRHAAQTLLSSARYRNSRHRSSSSKLRNHGLVFKKWRSFKKKSFKVKDRLRHWSAASSCSSRQESPIHSPAGLEDGRENFSDYKRRRDRNQYDIDNVIIPCDLKALGRCPNRQYKEIITPKWRISEELSNGPLEDGCMAEEDISDEAIMRSHSKAEIEERMHLRGGTHTGMSRRGRRHFHYESSGANTPDHVPNYQHDIFQDSNSMISGGPYSPGMSPPATPGSVHAMSDDSQWASGTGNSTSCTERRRTVSLTKREKSVEETPRHQTQEEVVRLPFEPRRFPLTEEEWQAIPHTFWTVNDAILSDDEKESVHEDNVSCPGSPDTSSSTSSNVEDVTDPEWTVVNRHNGPERTLILKLAKR